MKGLEIVNKWVIQLEGIKIFIEEDNNNGYSWFNYEKLYKYLEHAKKIKQDLEVLEILRSKLRLEYFPQQYPFKEICRLEFVKKNGEVTKEEYNKLKQWLEENE